MTEEQELNDSVGTPTLWTISVIDWILENPDFSSRISLGFKIEDPARRWR